MNQAANSLFPSKTCYFRQSGTKSGVADVWPAIIQFNPYPFVFMLGIIGRHKFIYTYLYIM